MPSVLEHLWQLIPPFDARRVLIAPWTDDFGSYGWILLMGVLVTSACCLVGNFLMLRRLSMMGDAISHSVLPGIAAAFLLTRSRSSLAMILGALLAGVVTSLAVETIHRRSRIKQDAAIGVVFSTLFAMGVVMISMFADRVDLDQDCVLFGEIAFVSLEPKVEWGGMVLGPASVIRMGVVAISVAALIGLFYKELLVSSFDAGLSRVLGIRTTLLHHGLTLVLSLVVVSAFEAVGAILVIAMLVVPGATASLTTERLFPRLLLSLAYGALSVVFGVHFAVWLDSGIAASMVLAGGGIFCSVWTASTLQGVLARPKSSLAAAGLRAKA